jgi:hypothetical protein
VWDATGNPGGSLYVTVPWANQIGWQDYQIAFNQTINMGQYINFECDIKVDTAHSTLTDSGDYGGLNLIAQNWNTGGQGWTTIGSFTIANTSGWQHFSTPLAVYPGVALQEVVALDANQYGSGTNHAGSCSYWIDNVQLTAPAVPMPGFTNINNGPLIGTMPCGGLVFDPRSGGEYERCMVYPGPAGTAMGWYNNTPATYSWSISQFPPTSTGYNLNVFWIPVNAMTGGQGDGAIDWNCTNSFILNYNAGNITWSAKTNLPGANPNVTLANIPYTGPVVGTWTVKFTDNTDLILTTPDGTPHPLAIDPAVVEIVSGNAAGNTAMQVYFGVMPGENYNIGVQCVWNNLQITNPQVSINDSFCPINATNSSAPSFLNTNVWAELGVLAYVDCCPTCLMPPLQPGQSGLTVYWPLGAYQLPTTLMVGSKPSGAWQDLYGPSGWTTVAAVPNTLARAVIHPCDLDAVLHGAETNGAYFRLVKRVATQLQVLLPGETNVPGTASGKIGTPDPQTAGNSFNITVNACDSAWHIISSSDTVAFSSTDNSAFIPGNLTLVNGTGSATVLFGQSGTWTYTATDQPPGTLTAGTSTPITIP